MATIRTEDASGRLHLSLLSSPKDHDNPNTGVYTYREEAQGKGCWIVIINTGYNWEQFPGEFGTPGERPLVLWNVPEDIRNRDLEEEEIAAGLHWPPDDNTDYGEPFDGVPEGHGTQTALLAGGSKTGVARQAGLYLIKAGGAVLDINEDVAEEDVFAESMRTALDHVVEKLKNGTLPPGKTVIVIDTHEPKSDFRGAGLRDLPFAVWNIEDMTTNGDERRERFSEWADKVEQANDAMDRLGGVMVSVAAGNDGKHNPPGQTGNFMPNILSTREGSPLVIVGAVTSQGQLARITSPASNGVPIMCYAMGKNLLLPDLSVEQDTLQSGTTFSASIVAGQAACMLSDPALPETLEWSSEDPKGDTVANRIKDILSEEDKGSFERVRREQMLDPASIWGQLRSATCLSNRTLTGEYLYRGYPRPVRLNVVCNSCATDPMTRKKRKSMDRDYFGCDDFQT